MITYFSISEASLGGAASGAAPLRKYPAPLPAGGRGGSRVPEVGREGLEIPRFDGI